MTKYLNKILIVTPYILYVMYKFFISVLNFYGEKIIHFVIYFTVRRIYSLLCVV